MEKMGLPEGYDSTSASIGDVLRKYLTLLLSHFFLVRLPTDIFLKW